MPRIKEDAKLEFNTVESAQDYITSLRGKVRFQVNVTAFLPTTDGRGFEGSTFVSISKADFLRVLGDMGRTLVNERNAKLVLRVSAPVNGRKDGLSFVALY